MTPKELERALRHCHAALGESLTVIAEMLNGRGDPDSVISRIEDAQAKYNAIAGLLNDLAAS